MSIPRLLLPCIAVLLMVPVSLRSQMEYNSIHFGPIIGVHASGFESVTYGWGEIGIARIIYNSGHSGRTMALYSASVRVSPGDSLLVAATVSGWYHALVFGAGWTLGYYSDLRNPGETRLIPQLYIGSDAFSICGGPHFAFRSSPFVSIPEGEIGIRWNFPMQRFAIPRKRG
jgi:hypothetical protein